MKATIVGATVFTLAILFMTYLLDGYVKVDKHTDNKTGIVIGSCYITQSDDPFIKEDDILIRKILDVKNGYFQYQFYFSYIKGWSSPNSSSIEFLKGRKEVSCPSSLFH